MAGKVVYSFVRFSLWFYINIFWGNGKCIKDGYLSRGQLFIFSRALSRKTSLAIISFRRACYSV